VIFSSHILPDAEALCDRVGILAKGRLREIVAIRDAAESDAYEIAARALTPEILQALERIAGAPPSANGGGNWIVRVSGTVAVRAAVDAIRAGDGLIEKLAPVHASLEERFLSYVGPSSSLD